MLYMTKSDYEKILAHCKEGLPNESCGLIGGVVVILRMVMVLMEIIKIISDTSGHDVQRCR